MRRISDDDDDDNDDYETGDDNDKNHVENAVNLYEMIYEEQPHQISVVS